MEWWVYPLLVAGGFAAGFVNTLAGGGSMLTLPLLILAGLPAHVANGTNRVAILVQDMAALAAFRSRGIRPWKIGGGTWAPACLGAVAGTLVAVRIDPLLLQRIFGAALIVVSLFVLLRPGRLLQGRSSSDRPIRITPWAFLIFFGVGFWGGFAQVGVGFLFLGAALLCSDLDLVKANAAKVFVILCFTVLSLALFSIHG